MILARFGGTNLVEASFSQILEKQNFVHPGWEQFICLMIFLPLRTGKQG